MYFQGINVLNFVEHEIWLCYFLQNKNTSVFIFKRMHVHFCEIPIENNVKNKEVKTTIMQVLKAKNSCSVKK